MSSNGPSQERMTAIVLAGQRSAKDPLPRHAGASCKALVRLGNHPLIINVLDALGGSSLVGKTLLSGPDKSAFDGSEELNERCQQSEQLSWSPPGPSPSSSAYQQMQTIPADHPVLVTSADQPLLHREIVETFCAESLLSAADVTIGLAPHALVQDRFPGLRKTVLRFSDGDYCGCNLFAFLTPQGRKAADYWRNIEDARKSPLQIIRILGWWPLLRYRLGWLSLVQGMELLSKRFGIRIRPVILPFAEAAIDVDSVEDYEILRGILDQKTAAETSS